MSLGLALAACTSGCGRSPGSLDGDWQLTSAVWNGESRPVPAAKAYVYRFHDGRYSMPVRGGLPSELQPAGDLPFERDGDTIRIRDGLTEIELQILDLSDTTLIVQPKVRRMQPPRLTFTRIPLEEVDRLAVMEK